MLLTVIYAFKGRCLMTEIKLWITRQQKFSHSYSDLASPIQPLAKEGYKYVLNFIDDYSGFVIFLKYNARYNEISS